MRLRLAYSLFTAAVLTASTSITLSQPAAIPDRPEKLQHPPLKYEPPAAGDYRVQLKSGPVLYIAEDRERPLVDISITVRTGDYTTPLDKQGLAEMTGYLMSRSGIPSRNADDLEERLAFLAAQLTTSIGNTSGGASLNLLSKDLDEGLALLREVLTAPQFQEDKITLRKLQVLQAMKRRNDSSAAIEGRERGFLAYGEKFWGNRHATAASVEGITRDDLIAFHRKWFHPANFMVAVSGDIAKAEMIARLEKLFVDWPFKGETAPPIPTSTSFAAPGVYLVDKDVNQGRVALMLPGIHRDDPDYFPAQVMNDILGGGGFTSRIMNRVRSDEGLAYSAFSSLPGGDYYPLAFLAGFQSKSRTVAYASSIVLEEMKRIANESVGDEEIQTAKNSFIETFPRNFASKRQIVSILADDEFTGRLAKDPNFWKTYRDKVKAVTREDVLRVARRFIQPDKLVILVVGQKKEILLGHPNHPVSLVSLAGGKLTDLPLRDPLTMKPITDSLAK